MRPAAQIVSDPLHGASSAATVAFTVASTAGMSGTVGCPGFDPDQPGLASNLMASRRLLAVAPSLSVIRWHSPGLLFESTHSEKRTISIPTESMKDWRPRKHIRSMGPHLAFASSAISFSLMD
jgi:hypothetical protein